MSADANDRLQLIVGTAGHIDHGKTALVRALTGEDLDRLPEEQARGITIDLGFAPLDLPDGRRVGIVDVPGHEGLVRTMVSGVSGIDLVVLVVAADEGVMPQTREHLAICNLLDVRHGLVALTRSDLVDDEMLELAAAEVGDLLAGTSLADAPMLPVSSLTGDGIDAFREALVSACDAAAPRTPRAGPARLNVDRVFTLRGFGSVVTGTLQGGALTVGDTVELLPGTERARVRGLHRHGEAVERAGPGARCAVNLQGIDHALLSRGQVLTQAETVPVTQVADARVHWLETSPEARDVTAVELLCGTTERRARLAPIGETPRIGPGESGLARIHIDGPPLAILPGDRFILRGFARHDAVGHTLGGGRFIDVAPPRRRRSDPALREELDRLADLDLVAGVALRTARTGLSGISISELARVMGLAEGSIDAGVAELETGGRVTRTPGRRVIDTAALETLARRLGEALVSFHAHEPLRPGMSAAALRATLPENVAREIADAALTRLIDSGHAMREGELVRAPEHAPTLDDRTRALVDRIERDSKAAGLEPPNPRDHCAELGIELDEYRDLVAHLERGNKLVRAPGDLWFDRAAIDALQARLVAHLEAEGEIDTQTYKALIGTSRRTAMPLMELFDDLQLTRRRGDARVLRSRI